MVHYKPLSLYLIRSQCLFTLGIEKLIVIFVSTYLEVILFICMTVSFFINVVFLLLQVANIRGVKCVISFCTFPCYKM